MGNVEQSGGDGEKKVPSTKAILLGLQELKNEGVDLIHQPDLTPSEQIAWEKRQRIGEIMDESEE